MYHQPVFYPLLTLLLLSLLTTQTHAQTVSTTPLQTCSLTTFSCPNTNRCCTIGGCCGSECCPNGYSCINEGTSSQACCSVWDTTRCGTVDNTTIINNQNNGNGNNSPTPQKNCNTIQNCGIDPVRKLGWTCLLGKTCGFSYNQCNACPYIFNIGASSSSTLLPSTTTTSEEEEETSSATVDDGGGGGSSTTTASTTSVATTAGAGTTIGGSGGVATTVPSDGVRGSVFGKEGWIVFVFVSVVGLVVL